MSTRKCSKPASSRRVCARLLCAQRSHTSCKTKKSVRGRSEWDKRVVSDRLLGQYLTIRFEQTWYDGITWRSIRSVQLGLKAHLYTTSYLRAQFYMSTYHVGEVTSSFNGWHCTANFVKSFQCRRHVLDLAYDIKTLQQVSRDERVPLSTRPSNKAHRHGTRFLGVVQVAKISTFRNLKQRSNARKPIRFPEQYHRTHECGVKSILIVQWWMPAAKISSRRRRSILTYGNIHVLAYTYYSLMPENLTGPKMTREDILRNEKRDSNLWNRTNSNTRIVFILEVHFKKGQFTSPRR